MTDLTPLPNQEAIRFLEKKGFKIGYHWADIWQGEHARAFTVAKVAKLDLLEDIRRSVDGALRDGLAFKQFKNELMPRLQKHGWTGFKRTVDPLTGEVKLSELGTPRRLRIIYDTNIRMANAAGRWERFERNKELLPILGYLTKADEKVREDHRRWHRFAAPVDHAIWNLIFPPNGWYCRCIVVQMTEAQARRRGFKLEAPAINMVKRTHPRTGQDIWVPEGVDPGFAYNVGKAHMKGLTPPPRSGPLSTPRHINKGTTTPMPKPRRRPRSIMLEDKVSHARAIDAFLDSFGVSRGESKLFTDKIGQPVVISEEFFRTPQGALKIGKSMRAREVLLLAETIKEPDEVWWTWERVARNKERTEWEYKLRRRYFARWRVPGEETAVTTLVAVEIGADGWLGITAFRPRSQQYLENQRAGTLAYIRE